MRNRLNGFDGRWLSVWITISVCSPKSGHICWFTQERIPDAERRDGFFPQFSHHKFYPVDLMKSVGDIYTKKYKSFVDLVLKISWPSSNIVKNLIFPLLYSARSSDRCAWTTFWLKETPKCLFWNTVNINSIWSFETLCRHVWVESAKNIKKVAFHWSVI